MGTIEKVFGGKVRVRVCGLCYKEDKILLVKHDMDGLSFYAPPGGAVEFGETIADTLKREFKEETCLDIVPDKLLFTTEYINPPLHAIEVFFTLKSWHGMLCTGHDPEMNSIIEDVAFYSASEITLIPNKQKHHLLHNCNNPRDLLALSGYIALLPDINK